MSLGTHELSKKSSRNCSCICSIWLLNRSLCLLDHEILQVTQVKATPWKVSVRTPKKHFDNILPNYQDSMTAILLCWPLNTQRLDAFKCQVPANKGQLSLEWLYLNPFKKTPHYQRSMLKYFSCVIMATVFLKSLRRSQAYSKYPVRFINYKMQKKFVINVISNFQDD